MVINRETNSAINWALTLGPDLGGVFINIVRLRSAFLVNIRRLSNWIIKLDINISNAPSYILVHTALALPDICLLYIEHENDEINTLDAEKERSLGLTERSVVWMVLYWVTIKIWKLGIPLGYKV